MPDTVEPEHTPIDPGEGGSATQPVTQTAALHQVRRVTIISARVLGGIIAVGIAGATIAAASILPLPSVRVATPGAQVTPVPTAEQIVCPGGLLRLSDAEGTSATTVSALGRADVSSASTTTGPDQSSFPNSDASTGGSSSAPQLLTAPPATSGSRMLGLLAGSESQSVSTNEFSGLASASCSPAAGGVWLAGGATTVGRTTLITLANPSAVASTVSLQIFGENGEVAAPGMDGIVVPANGQRVLSLAGFAPGLASPVVHVTSRGGQIVANLQQSTVRGLEPGGMDFVGAQPTPSLTTVIPGVVIANSQGVQSRIGADGFDDLGTILRVFIPGAKGATARVSVLPEGGSSPGNAFSVKVAAGSVADLPIDDAAEGGTPLADGSYTLVITTTVPVVAAVRVSTVGSASVANKADFAWLAAAQELRSDALVSIPRPAAASMTTTLHLANPTSSDVRVVVERGSRGSGSERQFTVGAQQAIAVPVDPGSTYRLTGFGSLFAAVSSTSDGGITGFTVDPRQESSTALRIYG